MPKGTSYIRHLIFFMASILLVQICSTQNTVAADTTLATVNGTAISATELDWEIKQLSAEMRIRNRPLSDQQLRQLRNQLIENLIEREVLYQHARAKNIEIRSQWIAASLSELKDQLGGSSALQAYLADTGMTQAQLKDRLAKGLTVRRLLRRDPIRSIKVSDAEMNAFYRQHPEMFQRSEQVRVRHILIKVTGAHDEAQRLNAWERIKTLQRKIDSGADFAVLALEYSDCPSRTRAGDLGYLTRDQMISPFAEAAFELEPGEVSDIVETRFGYHLIKMIDRKPPVLLIFKDVRQKIERTLRRDKENGAVRQYVANLKRQSEIKRFGSSR